MPLHDRDTIREQFEGCVFADRDLTRPVAKYRFPEEGTLPRDAFQIVADELMLRRAFSSLRETSGDRLSAVVVQPMTTGGVEVTISILQEQVSGPLVLFGPG